MNGTKTFRRIILSAVAFIVAVIVVTNVDFGSIGGPDRSVGNYCDAWEKNARDLNKRYQAVADSKDLAKTGEMFLQVPGDMVEFYDAVDKVAPAAIKPDIVRSQGEWEAYRDRNRELPHDLLGLLSNFGSNMMAGVEDAGTRQRIHDYNASNCPALPKFFN